MASDYLPIALVFAGGWLFCALISSDVRRALLDGLRCLGCHPACWRIPALFGIGYALFQLAAAAAILARTRDSIPEWLAAYQWHPVPRPLAELFFMSLLPAAEHTAAVFTIFIATFPLSAWFALQFLFNKDGSLREFWRILRHRLRVRLAAPMLALLLVLAAAALVKPAAYLLLPEIGGLPPPALLIAMGIDLLSCVFELLLGIYFLTLLMLLTHEWKEGLALGRRRLVALAMHRMGYVLRWSLLLALLSVLFLWLPGSLTLWLTGGEGRAYEAGAWIAAWIGRPLIAAVALIFCPVQTTLVFHNLTLRAALQSRLSLWHRHAVPIALFLGVAGGAFLAIECAASFFMQSLGSESAAALGCRMGVEILEALLAGWLISGWVCLYKTLTTGRKESLF